jgi:hypothetical protein
MRKSNVYPVAIGLLFFLIPCYSASAQESKSISAAVHQFSQSWSESAWQPRDNPDRAGYMWPLDNAGWKSRMQAFRSLVVSGSDAIGDLRRLLKDESPAKRILAAQTLQLVPCQELADNLVEAAGHDEEAAVRLYAVDALGTLDGQSYRDVLRRLQKTEKNRDVLRHITYALERRPPAPNIVAADALSQWNAERMDTARMGEDTPDFALTSLSGDQVTLSSFRGARSVALVFVYGDT